MGSCCASECLFALSFSCVSRRLPSIASRYSRQSLVLDRQDWHSRVHPRCRVPFHFCGLVWTHMRRCADVHSLYPLPFSIGSSTSSFPASLRASTSVRTASCGHQTSRSSSPPVRRSVYPGTRSSIETTSSRRRQRVLRASRRTSLHCSTSQSSRQRTEARLSRVKVQHNPNFHLFRVPTVRFVARLRQLPT